MVKNMTPFTTSCTARFVDALGDEWTMDRGTFRNTKYTFRNPQEVVEDGERYLKFTCTKGLSNGWLMVPVGPGAGYPDVYALIQRADDDGSNEATVRHLQLTCVDSNA
jgi:hypothetical protein